MTTYFRRISKIHDKLQPEHRGICTGDEVRFIRETLGIDSMRTELELRNIRDMAVMLSDIKIRGIEEKYGDAGLDRVMEIIDKTSAITGVIDNELWNRGYAV